MKINTWLEAQEINDDHDQLIRDKKYSQYSFINLFYILVNMYNLRLFIELVSSLVA